MAQHVQEDVEDSNRIGDQQGLEVRGSGERTEEIEGWDSKALSAALKKVYLGRGAEEENMRDTYALCCHWQ
jgi:hypothetical protein